VPASDRFLHASITHLFQAGGIAGTSVDLLFYPIDSIKTRLQSRGGFYKAGGFRGIYNGVGSVIVGSAPGGMLIKKHTHAHSGSQLFLNLS
jgi:Mitochondrial carrier protein